MPSMTKRGKKRISGRFSLLFICATFSGVLGNAFVSDPNGQPDSSSEIRTLARPDSNSIETAFPKEVVLSYDANENGAEAALEQFLSLLKAPENDDSDEKVFSAFEHLSGDQDFLRDLVNDLLARKDSESVYRLLTCILYSDLKYQGETIGKLMRYSLQSTSSRLQYLAIQVAESYNGEAGMGPDYQYLGSLIKDSHLRHQFETFQLL